MDDKIFINLSAKDLSPKDIFDVMHHMLNPRPVFLVSTASPTNSNVAPFSYVNACSTTPPTIMLAIHKNADGSLKDTLINIRRSNQFVLNAVDRDLIEKANLCATPLPHDKSEFEAFSIDQEYRGHTDIPHVKSSPFSIECDMIQEIPILEDNESYTSLILAKITGFIIKKEYYIEEGLFNFKNSQVLGRTGLNDYLSLDSLIELKPPHRQ